MGPLFPWKSPRRGRMGRGPETSLLMEAALIPTFCSLGALPDTPSRYPANSQAAESPKIWPHGGALTPPLGSRPRWSRSTAPSLVSGGGSELGFTGLCPRQVLSGKMSSTLPEGGYACSHCCSQQKGWKGGSSCSQGGTDALNPQEDPGGKPNPEVDESTAVFSREHGAGGAHITPTLQLPIQWFQLFWKLF